MRSLNNTANCSGILFDTTGTVQALLFIFICITMCAINIAFVAAAAVVVDFI